MKNEEEILRNFDKLLGTNKIKTIDKSKFPLILKLYQEFREDMFVETEEYKRLKQEKQKKKKKINNSFTSKQKQLFENYWDIEEKISSIVEEEIFIFAYLLRDEIEIEKSSYLR